MSTPISIRVLDSGDIEAFRAMLSVFGSAFGDVERYCANQPDDGYVRQLLENPDFLAPAAYSGLEIVGGLAGYVLPKFEQACSEFYIYDLAVAEKHRRRGVATALIEELKNQARQRDAAYRVARLSVRDALRHPRLASM